MFYCKGAQRKRTQRKPLFSNDREDHYIIFQRPKNLIAHPSNGRKQPDREKEIEIA